MARDRQDAPRQRRVRLHFPHLRAQKLTNLSTFLDKS